MYSNLYFSPCRFIKSNPRKWFETHSSRSPILIHYHLVLNSFNQNEASLPSPGRSAVRRPSPLRLVKDTAHLCTLVMHFRRSSASMNSQYLHARHGFSHITTSPNTSATYDTCDTSPSLLLSIFYFHLYITNSFILFTYAR